MKRVVGLFLLFLILIVEVSFLHFPVFLISSLIFLQFFRDLMSITVVFLFALALDALLVNVFGVTGFFVFLILSLFSFYSQVIDFRSRVVFAFVLIFSSLFYSMIVGYTLYIPFYILLFFGFIFFEMYMNRSKHVSDSVVPWV